jgi:thiamine-monophosphate kinase
MLLAKNRVVTACMDLSDGLADGLHQVAEASGVGVVVDADLLPIPSAARRWFDSHGIDAVDEALTAGDDYELLVAVDPRAARRFSAAIPQSEVSFTRVGTCTEGRQVVVRRVSEGATVEAALAHAGYRHFR